MTAAARLLPLHHYTGRVFLIDPESAALYEEHGGQRGEYTVRNMRPASAGTLLGPCRHPDHIQPEPKPEPTRPPLRRPGGESPYVRLINDMMAYDDERERRVAAYQSLVRSAAEEREYQDRRRAEEQAARRIIIGYDQLIRQSIRDKQETKAQCNVPGCTACGRPYMCGTRCDKHKPARPSGRGDDPVFDV